MQIRLLTGAALLAVALPVAAYAQAVIVSGIAEANVPKFRQYVVTERIASVPYTGEVVVGTVLPEGTIVYREIPPEFDSQYRYTVVNERILLVDPSTRKVVQIIERR